MKCVRNRTLLLTALALLLVAGCKNQWDDHNNSGNIATGNNLFEKISSNPNLSRFVAYLKTTKYDSILMSSKEYTVWAPTNQALEGLDTAITNNSAMLTKFVQTHICYVAYPYKLGQPQITVKTLGNSFITIYDQSVVINGSNLAQPYDVICRNGVLHVIDKAWIPKYTIWDIITRNGVNPKFQAFANLGWRNAPIDQRSHAIGVNSAGNTVYDTIFINRYINNIAPLDNADSTYTYLLMTDDVYNNEYTKFYPYCTCRTPIATDSATAWLIYKDMAIKGKYTIDNLPDTLVSKFGVKVPINKNNIVKTYDAANGIVYVLNKCSVRLQDKLQSIVIEAESYNFVSAATSNDESNKIVYDPNASGNYFVARTFGKGPSYYYDYEIPIHSYNIFSTNYNVYLRIPNYPDSRFTNQGSSGGFEPIVEIYNDTTTQVYVASSNWGSKYHVNFTLTPYNSNKALFSYDFAKPPFREVKISGTLLPNLSGTPGNMYNDYITFSRVDASCYQSYTWQYIDVKLYNSASSGLMAFDYIRLEPVIK